MYRKPAPWDPEILRVVKSRDQSAVLYTARPATLRANQVPYELKDSRANKNLSLTASSSGHNGTQRYWCHFAYLVYFFAIAVIIIIIVIIARLDTTVPAHQALRAHVNLSLGRNPDPRWKRRPGRPHCRWIDQIRKDNNDTPPADLWRREIGRGHGASLRPKLAMQ